jgi:biofilm PGA synthesis N-glycosyltransferase PgaC
MQSILRLKPLLFSFKYPLLSFQYVSHRVLRWTVTPFFLILALITNFALAFAGQGIIYQLLFAGQIFFYLLAFLGFIMEKRHIRVKALFVPYYFCVMNYAVLAGIHPLFHQKAKLRLGKSAAEDVKAGVWYTKPKFSNYSVIHYSVFIYYSNTS